MTTFAIKYVNFPKPGGKYGRLVDANGQTIWCPPDLLGMFRAGMTVDIGTKQQTWGQGETAREVTIATSGPQGVLPGVQQGHAYGSGPQARTAYAPPVRSNTGFQPRVVQGGGGAPDKDAKMIFVTGVVGRAMGSGKFTASEIGVLAQEAARSYELLHKPVAPPALAPLPVDDSGLPEEPPFPESV